MSEGRRGLGDYEPGRTGISVANLSDGAEMTVQGNANAYLDSTEHSDDAIHVPCFVMDAPDGFTDMSGEPVETVEDNPDNPKEYNIINSSTAFYEALIEAFGEEGRTDGQTFTIRASQPGDSFTRTYQIEV